LIISSLPQTGIEYALKTLDKTKLKKDALDNLRQEIRIMAQLDHPHIIRLHECFEDKKSIRLILELCTGGELLDRLHAQPAHKYTEQVACNYIHTMLSAIAYLHDHNIVHRDLKLENFLFESPSSDSQLKLIDFGLSQYFTENEIIVSPVGTPYYVSHATQDPAPLPSFPLLFLPPLSLPHTLPPSPHCLNPIL
jgi:calcium-dependent protein kinase